MKIAHAHTNKKDDVFMQIRLVQNSTFILKWGQGTRSFEVGSRDLFIDEAHTALDILPACCLVRFIKSESSKIEQQATNQVTGFL